MVININEIAYNRLILSIAQSLLDFEKAMERQQDITHFYEQACNVIQKFMYHAYHDRLPHPKVKGEYFPFFSQPISTYELPSLLTMTGERDLPIIYRTGKVHPFWVELLGEQKAYYSDEAENVRQIFHLIDQLPLDEQQSASDGFMRLRHLISDPTKSTLIDAVLYSQLIGSIGVNTDLFWRILQLFDEIHEDTQQISICPHCKGILDKVNGIFQCVHWRCQKELHSMQIQERNPESIDLGNDKYYRYTDWVQRFIRIPGIEEYRIGELTERRIQKYTDESEVIYNPDMDRVDLLVRVYGEDLIQGDVKDFHNPYHLAEKLNDYSDYKTGDLSTIYIVIPRTTINEHGSDYLYVVKGLLSNEKKLFLEIVSEEEWLKKVSMAWEDWNSNS